MLWQNDESYVVSAAGSIAGILGVTYATFTAVSYQEVKRKIDEQVARGEDPYQLKTEDSTGKRAKPVQKKKKQSKRK